MQTRQKNMNVLQLRMQRRDIMTKKKFETLYQETSQKYEQLNRHSNQIAILRFLLGIGVIAFLCIGYFKNVHWLYGCSLLSLICFLLLIRYHDRIKKDCAYHASLSQIYQQHIQRIDGQWDTFKNNGNEFLTDKDYKSLDLDILSQHSLFQMINLAFTKQGQEKLAKTLSDDNLNKTDILKRQEAVREISEHEDFVFQIQALANMLHTHQKMDVQDFTQQKNNRFQKITPLIFIVSFITIISLICLCFSIGSPYSQITFEIGAVFQFCFAFLYYKKHMELFEPVTAINKGMQNYLEIFKRIERIPFKSQNLLAIQTLMTQRGNAVKGIQELSQISQRIGYRQNIFVIIVLNALGLYDFWIRNQYISWLEQYQNHIENWFNGLADIEVYMSLSVLKIDDFDVVMPQINETKTLSFQNLRHPLIKTSQVVGNDFTLKESICVITGSNMSGKTTFMRTIGLNLVLAYAGGYVFAKNMVCSPMHIMTSMRVKDNVEEGVSTFYGELLRIKEMITYAKHQKPMICLIDEIFKGTNSLDRIAGAKATMEKLSLPYAMTFLTTHDFELCHSDHIAFENYHFDEQYEDNKIIFDYKIKEGKSQSTNGQFLLRQLGIIED